MQHTLGKASEVSTGTAANIPPEATNDPMVIEAPEHRPHEAERDLCPSEEQDSADASSLVQHPVYFVSTVLREARACYTMPQKLLLALLVASRKLRHYFQGQPIKVVSVYPLERVLRSPNAAGQVAEWNIELQALNLEFSTTRVIKGAALADFMAEWTDAPNQGEGED